MKEKEKKFLFMLTLISIIIIILELTFVLSKTNQTCSYNIKQNEIFIGTCNACGSGIEININDGNDLIHQEDIIILLDECKNAGSEVISVNGVRITSNSYIYCDGGVILIDGKKIGNPFKIKVIGDSQTLYSSLNRNKGYIDTLKNDGINITIEEKNNIQILKTQKQDLYDYIENKNNLVKLNNTCKLSGKSDIYGKGIQIYFEYDSATALTLIQIINDLNSANVKAIEINGNRILSNTDIMDINKKYILLDSIPLSHSFLIYAIGNQEKILETLKYSNSMINKLKYEKNVPVLIEKNHFIKINKYTLSRGQNKLQLNNSIPIY